MEHSAATVSLNVPLKVLYLGCTVYGVGQEVGRLSVSYKVLNLKSDLDKYGYLFINPSLAASAEIF